MGIDKFRRQGYFPKLNVAGLDVYSAMNLAAIQGTVYFVEGNAGLDTNDGLSWAKAKKTLASAITASNVVIAADKWGWAARNTIYVKGDRIIEDLVTLPQKTDVIGVGSCDRFKYATIQGNHVIVGNQTGCRFFNVGFEPGAAADLWTLLVGSNGIEFHSCEFRAESNLDIVATRAIKATACVHMKVINCMFGGAFVNNYIDMRGYIDGTVIEGNNMNGGADNGIMVTAAAALTNDTGCTRGLIKNNFIQCADIVIDVNAISAFDVVDNICISGEALGAGSYVIDLTYAARNCITGSDVSVYVPSLTTVA